MSQYPERTLKHCRACALRLVAGLVIAPAWLGPSAFAGDAPVDFARDVQPIFVRNCRGCHGPDKQRGALRLDDRASILAGGDSGEPAVTPGDVAASPLIERVSTGDESLRMPPKGARLAAGEVAILKRWVAQGARWFDQKTAPSAVPARTEMKVTESDRAHWSFRPLTRDDPPRLHRQGPEGSAVDRFLLAKLEAKQLEFSPEAERRTLIRRLAFGLTGLPPTPAETSAFVADSSPGAYERLLDRLLASPHYGERWGRHWLDLARYADSDGYENDLDRKAAFRYRDFVIRALNDDMPYDQFVRWQLAGDECDPADPAAMAATGFCTAAPCQDTTPADTEENKAKIRGDELDNIVASTGSALLGLSLGCARCHDHKFDPIPTRDYYRIIAAFTSSERCEVPMSQPQRQLERWKEEQRRLYREDKMQALNLSEEERFWLRQPEHFFVPVQMRLYKQYGKTLEPSTEQLVSWMTPAKRATFQALQSAAAQAQRAGADPSARGLVLLDRGAEPARTYLLGRGSVTNKQELVTLGFLQVLLRGASAEDYLRNARQRAALCRTSEPALSNAARSTLGTTYQRLALSEWITDQERGAGALLARVIVNRIWQHHFGEGLVRTPDDFGVTGDRPEHAELLDWLAGELIRHDWRLKPIHRLILTSAAYRQAISSDQTRAAIDPDNRLLWHRRPVRLEAEAIRDAMLAASGRLNRTMYGPAFRPIIPAEAIATRSKDAYPTNVRDGPPIWRRSIYAFLKRSVPNPLAEVFDQPDSTATCGRRNATAVPTQSLALLNDPFVRSCAQALARRVAQAAGPDGLERTRLAYELALARPPRPEECAAARAFLSAGDGEPALADLCHVLFTLNEFLYVD